MKTFRQKQSDEQIEEVEVKQEDKEKLNDDTKL